MGVERIGAGKVVRPAVQRGRPSSARRWLEPIVAAVAAVAAPLAIAALLGVSVVTAAEHVSGQWHTTYQAAMAEAEATGKPVLALFTGSDWCPHCKILEKNVLQSGEFKVWAGDNLVLLMVDLPEHGISEAVRQQRSVVCRKYGVSTFPHVVLIGPDGAKIGEKKGYRGQAAPGWIADMAQQLPARPPVTAVVSAPATAVGAPEGTTAVGVLGSLDAAIETARGTKRPILLVVARPGDKAARSHSDSLINDPEFAPFVKENFVVAHVPPTAVGGTQEAESMENLLGGVELAPEAVELIVTDDGQTPLFSQSGAQPPARIVHGLRRFLAARQASRFGDTPRR